MLKTFSITKFSKYLLIGCSVLVLLYVAQNSAFQNIQEVQAISCTPGQSINTCHTLTGAGHTYCVWHADGNTEGPCSVESCFNGGNPPDCGGPAPCMTKASLCGENTQYCENTTGQGSAMIFKHAGVCNPSNGGHDSNGCIFLFDNVRSFTGKDCKDVSVPPPPAPQPAAPQPQAPAPQPQPAPQKPVCNSGHERNCYACGTAGAPQGQMLCQDFVFVGPSVPSGTYDCTPKNPESNHFVSCPPAPAPPVVTPTACPGSCGGSEREGLDSKLNWDWKTEFDDWCRARDGSRAYCYIGSAKVAAPAPACVSDRSCSAPAPACGTTTTGVDNCGKACTKQGTACVAGCVPSSCSVSTPSACGQRNTGVDNCGNVCIKESAACAAAAIGGNVSATGGSASATGGSATAQGGSGGSSTVTITNPAPQAANVILASAGNVGVGTTVSGVQVTTLPKTGLPIFAWTALAFIPAGFRMRRFSQVKKDLENHPSYIFEDRQFKGRA